MGFPIQYQHVFEGLELDEGMFERTSMKFCYQYVINIHSPLKCKPTNQWHCVVHLCYGENLTYFCFVVKQTENESQFCGIKHR